MEHMKRHSWQSPLDLTRQPQPPPPLSPPLSELSSFITSWLHDTSSPGHKPTRLNHVLPSDFAKKAKSLPDRPADDVGRRADSPEDCWSTYTKSLSASFTMPSAAEYQATHSTTGRSLVETATYRTINLLLNDIVQVPFNHQPPSHLQGLLHIVLETRDAESLTLSPEDQQQLCTMQMGASEGVVEAFLNTVMFPMRFGCLRRDDHLPVLAVHVPQKQGCATRLGRPVPDALMGYDFDLAFPDHRVQLASQGTAFFCNSSSLVLPFLTIEYKAEGPGGGNMWVGVNQATRTAAMCVRMAERLNQRLHDSNATDTLSIDTTAFAVAVNNVVAHLYVAWMDGTIVRMQQVEIYVLRRPQELEGLHQAVRATLRWAESSKLQAIRNILDVLS